MKLKIIATFLSVIALMLSCTKSDDSISETTPTPSPNPELGSLINVVINASATELSTKVSYTPDNDMSKFMASWDKNDNISVIIPNTTGNSNQKFTASSSTNSSELSGSVATWSGEKSVYALYPYQSSGYQFDNESKSINTSIVEQNIDLSDNNFSNGLMVSSISGATAISSDNYNFSNLSFKQVMSFFQLDLIDIPNGEVVNEISFSSTNNIFIKSADINVNSGELDHNTAIMTNKISASIDNQLGSSAFINFAVLPINLIGKEIALTITTKNGNTKKDLF